MNETTERGEIQKLMEVHEAFAKAHPSQGMLEEISVASLPDEYRQHIVLRMDRDNLYVAFSNNPEDLIPDENGYMQEAQIIRLSAYNGPRKTGVTIKEWVDKIRPTKS